MKPRGAVLTALAIIAIAFLSLAQPGSSQTGPSLTVEEPVRDIGIVESGATVTHTFVLRNDGDAVLEIINVDPDCGCTVVEYDRRIAPGQTGKIKAEVDVSTFFGPIAKYLVVFTNDPSNPEFSLAVKVEVRPLVQIHPGYVRFLSVVGETVERSDQTIWASDIENLEIRNVRSPYRFVSAEVHEAKEGEERSEGQGRQWVIEVELAPNAPVGPMADYIVLDTNHPKKPQMRIPVSGFVRPVLAASPPFADFGQREVLSPIRASVEIKNFSEDEIELTEVVSSLPEVEARIQRDGDDYYVIVTLNPGLPSGDFSGTVTVTTDSARVPTLEIEVKGTVL
jgi:hypothetical protein